MQAKFPGRCPGGDRIRVGDTIARDGRGRWAHPGHDSRLAVTYAARSAEFDEGYENAKWEAAEARAERNRDEQEYAAGIEDANRERFNRQMFGEAYAAAEEYARDLRGLNGDW